MGVFLAGASSARWSRKKLNSGALGNEDLSKHILRKGSQKLLQYRKGIETESDQDVPAEAK